MPGLAARRVAEVVRKNPGGARRVCVFNLTRQSFLSFGVEVADTQWKRMRGLLGRLRLRADDGVWLVPSQGVHTVGLFFPIDVVYLDANSRAIHLVEHLKPFRISPLKTQSRSVLELPARSIFCSDTKPGDRLIICSAEELAKHLNGNQPERHVGDRPMSKAESDAATASRSAGGGLLARVRRWFRVLGDRRRNRRSAVSGVVAYYWEGGTPGAHQVRNLSKSGAHIAARNGWYPGTIVELTIQQEVKENGKPRQAVNLASRVVRCDPEGVGVRFLFSSPAERAALRRLLSAAKVGRR